MKDSHAKVDNEGVTVWVIEAMGDILRYVKQVERGEMREGKANVLAVSR